VVSFFNHQLYFEQGGLNQDNRQPFTIIRDIWATVFFHATGYFSWTSRSSLIRT